MVVFSNTLLMGCNQLELRSDKEEIVNFTAEQIFEKGEKFLKRNKNAKAATYFSEIERLHPYSELVKRALILQAYAYHKDKKYEESRAPATRFLDFYPEDRDADYAQYLLALSYYDQIYDIGRDQALTINALQELRTLIEQYPNSKYVKISEKKFDLALDHLAAKEMEVGRYYLKGKHYIAAINRFRSIVEDFQTTSHTAEALYRLIEAYLSIGLEEEAQTAGAILNKKYKDTDWQKRSFKLLANRGISARSIGDSWLSKIHRQVIKGQWL